MKNGVLGLSIRSPEVGNWDAYSVDGKFEYAGCISDITATSKHKVYYSGKGMRAEAWQFTINVPRQFAQLCLDGVNTQLKGRVYGEKLVGGITFNNNQEPSFKIKVFEVKENTDSGTSYIIVD